MESLNIRERLRYEIVLDINQPGEQFQVQEGIYQTGPIISRVVKDSVSTPSLPVGTLLYGHLWTEGLTKRGRDAVYGRYTEALLPDGRRVRICFALWDDSGLYTKMEGSKPGAARLPRVLDVMALDRLP